MICYLFRYVFLLIIFLNISNYLFAFEKYYPGEALGYEYFLTSNYLICIRNGDNKYDLITVYDKETAWLKKVFKVENTGGIGSFPLPVRGHFAITQLNYFVLRETSDGVKNVFKGEINSRTPEQDANLPLNVNQKVKQIFCYDNQQIVIVTEGNEFFVYDVIRNELHYSFKSHLGNIYQSFLNLKAFKVANSYYQINSIANVDSITYNENIFFYEFSFVNDRFIIRPGNSLLSINREGIVETKVDGLFIEDRLNLINENIYAIRKINQSTTSLVSYNQYLNPIDTISLSSDISHIIMLDANNYICNFPFDIPVIYRRKINLITKEVQPYFYSSQQSFQTLSDDLKFIHSFDNAGFKNHSSIINLTNDNVTFYEQNNNPHGIPYKGKVYYDNEYGFIYQSEKKIISNVSNLNSNFPTQNNIFSSNNDISLLYYIENELIYLEANSLFSYNIKTKKINKLVDNFFVNYIFYFDFENIVYLNRQSHNIYNIQLFNLEKDELEILITNQTRIFCSEPIFSTIVRDQKIFVANNDNVNGNIKVFNLITGEFLYELTFYEKYISSISSDYDSNLYIVFNCTELAKLELNSKNIEDYSLITIGDTLVPIVHYDNESSEHLDEIEYVSYSADRLLVKTRKFFSLFVLDPAKYKSINSVETSEDNKPKLNEVLNQPYDMISVYDIMGKKLFSSGEWQSDNNFYRKYNQPVIIQVQSGNKYHIFKVFNE